MTEHEQKYAVRVTPSDKIRFRCTLCGACCRNVKETVPVDCKDAFYLTKHLRDLGMDIYCVDQFLEQYAEPALLDECGFFVYFLKSVGEDNACIFLKDNRCSVQEAKPHPDMLVYSASKAAQTNMMQSLALQLASYGITVNNVAPGVIYTDRNLQVLSDPVYAKKVTDSIPVGFYGEPRDCAGIVSLLCSEEGRYITGQSIFVDGGKSVQ